MQYLPSVTIGSQQQTDDHAALLASVGSSRPADDDEKVNIRHCRLH